MIDKYLIYALVDPRDGQYRYIGQSSRGMSRPLEHIKPRYYNKSKRKVYCWIRSCISRNEKLGIKIIRSDGEIYSSKGDAARALGVDRGSITRAIKLDSFCKGYRFSLV